MTEYQRETAFLGDIIRYEDTDERRELEKQIAQVQRDQACVERAALLAGLCTVLALAGLGYAAIFQDDSPYSESPFSLLFLWSFGIAAVICLVAFAGLLLAYHRKLSGLREECRQLIARIFKSHLSEPQSAMPPVSRREFDDHEIVTEAPFPPGGQPSLKQPISPLYQRDPI